MVKNNFVVIKDCGGYLIYGPFLSFQWECRTDMDNAYRFGRIEVSCEGYNHPADAYILKGSCGLEYTLELTREGRGKHTGSHSGFSAFGGSMV